MDGLLGQEITKGSFVAHIDVYQGSCDSSIGLVAEFTPAKVRIFNQYLLEDMAGGNDEENDFRPSLCTPTRLIVISEETARNVLGDSFEAINEFRQTLL